MEPNKAADANASSPISKKRSMMWDVWKRFKKNKTAMLGLIILAVMVILAIFADIIAPGTERLPGYDIQNLRNAFQPPSREHIFGTDNFGRDVFARIVHGSRISLLIGLVVVSISMISGIIIGSIAGFYGGIRDNFLMRIIDILMAIPHILLAISIAAALGPGLFSVMVAVGISAIPAFARIVKASVLSLREQEFIEAARSIGASNFRIITKHVLPNCMAPIIVQATMGMASGISWAASLSFIGVGIQPPVPEWGAMLAESRRFIRDHWHMVVFPGVALASLLFALNMIGDGLRDAFDPRLKR